MGKTDHQNHQFQLTFWRKSDQMHTIFFDHRERVFVGDWRRRGPFLWSQEEEEEEGQHAAAEDVAHSQLPRIQLQNIINAASGFLKLGDSTRI